MPHSEKRKKKTPSKLDDYETSFSHENRQGSKLKHTKQKERKARDIGLFFFSNPEKNKYQTSTSKKNLVKKQFLTALGIDNMKPADYIASPLDQNDSVAVTPVNLLKKQGGRGLFAKQYIPAGTCIGVYTGVVFESQKDFDLYFKENPNADNAYTMNVGAKVVDGAIQGNFTRYINFSDSQPNTMFVEGILNRRKVAKVMTTRDLYEGEQLLIDYNQYSEDFSKKYFFLNPEDGMYSAKEIRDINCEEYTLMEMTADIDALQIKENDFVYATTIGNVILQNGRLSRLEIMPDQSALDLPFLKTSRFKVILDFDEADNFTPLMLACYAGQLENVDWLTNQKVNINRQQHHSGNCPLFLALDGYADGGINDRAIYREIIQLLIKKEANILIHDRADMTFIHKAISVLSTRDFKSILTLIQEQEHILFSDLFTYLDESDLDILFYCLNTKFFDKAKILLDMFPDYFNESSKNKQQKFHCKKEFKNAISDYNEVDKSDLMRILGDSKYNVPAEFLDALTSNEEEQPSYSL
ncbi:hypothetical protein TUM19329_20740 [Legionella antarctica]|uniref:SET domain-containing protein n=1 Tax=Legionella antarctica TaxID=2708020 RepID=A0A6F8T679_9GAMM|nr:Dot/Icm T4SS effector AnkI/LegAS4 [Legionella antarctica]BCA95713.1 hypothetical protein TUM19329_20740 [Legionella antarctica]